MVNSLDGFMEEQMLACYKTYWDHLFNFHLTSETNSQGTYRVIKPWPHSKLKSRLPSPAWPSAALFQGVGASYHPGISFQPLAFSLFLLRLWLALCIRGFAFVDEGLTVRDLSICEFGNLQGVLEPIPLGCRYDCIGKNILVSTLSSKLWTFLSLLSICLDPCKAWYSYLLKA